MPKREPAPVETPDPTPAPAAEIARDGDPVDLLVWLVEDEQPVGRLIRDGLEREGYRVRWFSSAEEALESAVCGRRADLLLTDLTLPGLSGIDLARELKRTWPGLPVLVTSGYLQAAEQHEASLPGEFEYLAKPFTPRTLLKRLALLRAQGLSTGSSPA